MKLILEILALVVAGYGAWAAALYLMQRRILFPRGDAVPDRTAAGVPEMEETFVTSRDGVRLLCWFHAPTGAGDTVAYFHGNAGTIEGRGGKARTFLDRGYGMMLAEYRGYGGNGGRPSETSLVEDAIDAVDALRERGIEPGQVILYGESLGTAVAAAAAAHLRQRGTPVKAVILEAPFTSIADLASERYPVFPVRALLKDPFDSMARIAGIGAPLLIVHGTRDRTVPLRHGERLFKQAAEPKRMARLEGAGHTDVDQFGAVDAMWLFLKGLN